MVSHLNLCVGHRVHKWSLLHFIGAGSFGEIYLAKDFHTNENVTIKVEKVNSKRSQLYNEFKTYYSLNLPRNRQVVVGIPKVHWFGKVGEYDAISIELLGKSLQKLFSDCHHRFSLKNVLMLADQMIQRIEYIHSRSFLHRDLKPSNFVMGLGDNEQIVYVVDFGLSMVYLDPNSQAHVPYKNIHDRCGTARYASINAHRGMQQSRRDDLESLGYLIVYFIKGSLPWDGLGGATKSQQWNNILCRKLSTPIHELCANCPVEIYSYLTYCRSLRFDDTPDYAYLKDIFRGLFHKQGFSADSSFDWTSTSDNSTASVTANE